MKRLYTILLSLAALLCLTTACNEDQELTPANIANLSVEALEGSALLRWEVPADSSYLYIRISYQHPVTGEAFVKNISTHTDSVIVSGMLAKDGEYTFTLQTVSATESVNSVANTVQCRVLPVQPTIEKYSDKIELTVKDVSTNAQEETEGPIANLIDGNTTNFFHTDWHNRVPAPHWIDIALPAPVDKFEFTTWYRGGSYGSAPSVITLLGSNDNANWEVIQTLKDEGAGKSKYVSPVVECDKEYAYLRYRCDETPGGKDFFNLAEMEVSKVRFDIYDPEGIYVPGEQ